jgi:diaminohydroxyphosphoribosylaminopyrimidine deaminase / 5-amino-6-(5-phosphoribosylamino)uracil reductase
MADPAADVRYMRRALELAEAGWGRVHPNPLVGAVVVRQGVVVGEGAHREFGGPHAEVEALRAAGGKALGATLYVTLEPCAHYGKTPPCVNAIVGAGIHRVVIATEDPHPVGRGGAVRLRQAGIEVEFGVEARAARSQNALFLAPVELGRPFVSLKLATTLDARLGREGQATRITGSEAEAEVHRLRSGYDAILIGGRTARTDNPRLTVRRAPAGRVPPVRIVADTAAHLPMAGALVAGARDVPLWVLAGRSAPEDRVEALEAAGVRVLRCAPGEDGQLDLRDAIGRVGEEGIRTVLCEGGGRLGAGLLRQGLVDRLLLFLAPSLLGVQGVPAFPVQETRRAPLRLVGVSELGGDTLLTLDRGG